MKTTSRITIAGALGLLLAAAFWATFRTSPAESERVDRSNSSPQRTPETATSRSAIAPRESSSHDVSARLDEASLVIPAAPATRVRTVVNASDEAMSIGAGGRDFAARYDELVARAKSGDNAAAEELGSALLECRLFLRTQRQHESQTAPSAVFPSDQDQQAAEAQATRFRQSANTQIYQEKCDGLTEQQLDGALGWYELAAQRGDVAAALAFVSTGVQNDTLARLARQPEELARFRTTASSLAHRAASECYPAAFHALAGSYRTGSFVNRDIVTAMAYTIVAAWLGGQSPTAGYLRGTAALSGAEVSDAQLARAASMASRLYQAHCQ